MAYFSENYFGDRLPAKRTFSEDEAKSLAAQAKESKKTVKYTKRGYKALSDIAIASAQNHVAWRAAQVQHGKAATMEASADAKAIQALGPLAVKHAEALSKAKQADKQAEQAVKEYSNQFMQEFSLFGLKIS
ncbi:hypothetical protein [Aerosakkonema funiforme]|uniref:hypothetical protein n=1 Tax=Aerosakkonema funiforme TaxID=1246630 RepID=UPI0035B8038E